MTECSDSGVDMTGGCWVEGVPMGLVWSCNSVSGCHSSLDGCSPQQTSRTRSLGLLSLVTGAGLPGRRTYKGQDSE